MTTMQNPKMRDRRRELRCRSTEAERRLWEVLKLFRRESLPFRRQYSVEWYILDFYCPKLKLAIEVDGPIHDRIENQENDKIRENFLKSTGIQILRFKNDEVINDLSSVINKISFACKIPFPRARWEGDLGDEGPSVL